MNRRAQGTIEYMILIGVIVGALIAMGVYMRRAMHGRIRECAGQLNIEEGYAPRATDSMSLALKNTTERIRSYSEPIDSENPDPDKKYYITETDMEISQTGTREDEMAVYGLELGQEPELEPEPGPEPGEG